MASVAPAQFAASPVPVIDLTRFRRGEAEARALAAEIDRACRTIGFLVIVNHGVDPALIAEFRALSRAIFDLPSEIKQRYLPRDGSYWGYSAVGAYALERTVGGAAPLGDLREAWAFSPMLHADPADPYYAREAARPFFQPNVLPSEVPALGATLERFYAAMSDLAAEIMELFALALDLPRDFFAASIARHITNLSVTDYPNQPVPPAEGQLRAGAHTDFGTLTILHTEDKPGGLEVFAEDGRWHAVPILPDSFIINIGDLMAMWTNNRWRSTLHRVVNPPREQAMDARRLSLTFFHQPNYDAEIRCLPSCIGDGARYPPTTSGAHILKKLGMAAVEG